MIPFKAKAWLDLKERKERGNHVDSRDIKKHKNDIIRLSMLLVPDNKIEVPDMIKNDLSQFIQNKDKEDINLKQLRISNIDKKFYTFIIWDIWIICIAKCLEKYKSLFVSIRIFYDDRWWSNWEIVSSHIFLDI